MPTLGGRILSTCQFLKSLYQVLCKNIAFMGCTVPSKKSIYHLYIRPTNRYIAYISSKHRCIPLNIIYTSLLISPYQELFKNIAFHANPGKRTLLKGGGGAVVPNGENSSEWYHDQKKTKSQRKVILMIFLGF